MNYEQTLEYLFKQLPMYQREGKSAYKKDLNNTIALCNLLDKPQNKFKSIHVAGTNGKGSSSHMLASIFQESGYKTGLYTSPHLKDFRERIRINGVIITENTVIDFVKKNQAKFQLIKPSFFEWTVALAFQTFALEKVDIAIIETGLGGRLDSTNVISPELSIITNIGLDHTEMLGESLDLIAIEKAGIIKEGIPVIIGNHSRQKEIFNRISNSIGAPAYYTTDLKIEVPIKTDLLGVYQIENAKTVYHAWLTLRKMAWKISYPQFQKGLENVAKNTGLRGRWEILGDKPMVIAETAHNVEGLTIALTQLSALNKNKIHFVIGFVNDKNIDSVLSLFPKDAMYYFCQAKIPRALNAELLKNKALDVQLLGSYFQTVEEAYEMAKSKAEEDDIIYVGGSNFIVAEVL